jgi:hypothetical protein
MRVNITNADEADVRMVAKAAVLRGGRIDCPTCVCGCKPSISSS